jgi:hypothetical protein
MTVRVDLTPSGAALTWAGPSQLVDLGGGQYRTPHKFVPTTLLVMHRGLPVAAENADGYTVLDEETFELKEPLTRPASWLMVGYVKL